MKTRLAVQSMVALTVCGCVAAATLPTVQTEPPGSSYRLRLKSFTHPAVLSPLGLLIPARINGGPPLRLLLDTGAQFLTLTGKAATRCGLKGSEPLDLVSSGGSQPRNATTAKATTVTLENLTLPQVQVAIVDGTLAEGLDGAFPLALFAGYLIRLDIPAKALELTRVPSAPATGTHALQRNGLLFVKAVLNETHEGYFLLDTGAAYNAVSAKLARHMKSAGDLGSSLALQSGTSRFDAKLVPEVLRFRVGKQDLLPGTFVSIDLSTASHYYDFEVSGLVGYPALRSSVLTINYEQQLVQIEHK